MRKIILTLSSLFAMSLSGCATNPNYQTEAESVTSDQDSLVLKGEDDSDNAASENQETATDWLTAWRKKPNQEFNRTKTKGFGFSRWFNQSPRDNKEDSDTEADEEGFINLWDTVGENISLVDPNHPRIQKAANFYARNQRFLDYISDQGEPYFNFVLSEVQRRNLPVELALLPAIESAYQPRATSPRRAAGLWQLIPGTARNWGLELNHHYDGRRDVFASTQAALDYLEKLNDDFEGDWLLAMAAYNCGEFGVSRAIRKNVALGKPTDFWSLDLPNETRNFVPRILGLAAVIAEPQNYGVQLKALRDRPVVPVKIDYQMDLAKIAEIADLSLHEVTRLNPAYRKGKTDADGGNLLLPITQAQIFQERLAAMDPQDLVPASKVTDTPSPLAVIKHQANNEEVEAAVEQAENRSNNKISNLKIHVVSRGDTIKSIARINGVRVKDLIAANHLKARSSLTVGQRLTLTHNANSYLLTKKHKQSDKPNAKSERIAAKILDRTNHHQNKLNQNIQRAKSGNKAALNSDNKHSVSRKNKKHS